MVSRKTESRGRPQLDLLQDADRFAVALAFALRTLGSSENTAFRAVAALAFGSKVSAEEVAARRKRGRGAIPAGPMVTYERAAHKGGATIAVIDENGGANITVVFSGASPGSVSEWLGRAAIRLLRSVDLALSKN